MSSQIIRIECVKFGAHVNIHDLVVRNIKEGPDFAQSALLPRLQEGLFFEVVLDSTRPLMFRG
jgi:hypothetical protein